MSEFTYEDTCTAQYETIEWDQFWLEHTEDAKTPRVLYIGDSISAPTRAALNGNAGGKVRVDGLATSKALDNPWLRDLILFYTGREGHCDLILFNNGLHGWHLDDAEAYPKQYAEAVRFLKEKFPEVPMEIVLTTPVRNEDTEKRVLLRNEAARRIAEDLGCGVLDYHSIPGIADCLGADGIHFTPEGYGKLAQAAMQRICARLDVIL